MRAFLGVSGDLCGLELGVVVSLLLLLCWASVCKLVCVVVAKLQEQVLNSVGACFELWSSVK